MINSANPSVTILILNWNGRQLLPKTLPALMDLDYDRYKVVLADNGSTDGSIEFVEEHFPEISLIDLRRNLGFTLGINEAVRRMPAEEEILILLNNDVTVYRDWLSQLVVPFEDPQVGITGCKLLYPDENTIQHAGAELIYPIAYSKHYHYQELDIGQADDQKSVSYVTGASMAIRRSLIQKDALFDEQFIPFYYEEVDLCYRIRNAGYEVVYVPKSVAIHHESFSMENSTSVQWIIQRNRLRFVLKHSTEDQFIQEFVPAEIKRLQETPNSIKELIIIRQAYLDTLLSLPKLVEARGQQENYSEFQAAIDQLMQAALSESPTEPPLKIESSIREDLAAKQRLSEFEFESDASIVGPAIASFRRRWNDVSTKWVVRSIIQQQQAFNELVAKLLVEQEVQLRSVAGDVTTLADEIVTLKGQVAALNERLQQHEHSAAQDGSSKSDSVSDDN